MYGVDSVFVILKQHGLEIIATEYLQNTQEKEHFFGDVLQTCQNSKQSYLLNEV